MKNLRVVLLLGGLVVALIAGLYSVNAVLFSGPDVGTHVDGPETDRTPDAGLPLAVGTGKPRPAYHPRGNPERFTPGTRRPEPGPDEIVTVARIQGLMDIALGDDQTAALKAWRELGDLVRLGVLSDPVGVSDVLVRAMETGGNAAIWAAKVLPWITDEIAREKMARDLTDLAVRSQDVQVLKAAFKTLGDLRDGSVVDDLGRLSRSLVQRNTVAAAIHAIGEIGTPESARVLAELLVEKMGTDQVPLVVKAMGSVESKEMVQALLPFMDTQQPAELRLAAIEALGLTHRADGVGALETVLSEDNSAEVKRTAFAALGRIGTPESIGALIRSYRDGGDLAYSAGLAVGNAARPEAVEKILESIDTVDDPKVKVKWVDALGNSKSADSVPKLREMVSSRDENPDVRGRAALSLAKLGDVEAVSGITDAIEAAPAGETNMVIHLTDAVKRLAQYPRARKELIEKTLPVLVRLTSGTDRGNVYYYALSARQTLEACRQR